MKKAILLFSFTFLISNYLFSQAPLVKQWDYRYGGIANEWLLSLQQTYDGGYILGGYSYTAFISGDKTEQSRGGPIDYWIVKVDSLGKKQWDKTIGGKNNDYLYSLQQTSDSGYILGGHSLSDIGGEKKRSQIGILLITPMIIG